MKSMLLKLGLSSLLVVTLGAGVASAASSVSPLTGTGAFRLADDGWGGHHHHRHHHHHHHHHHWGW